MENKSKTIILTQLYTVTNEFEIEFDEEDYNRWCESEELDPNKETSLEKYAVYQASYEDPTFEDWNLINQTVEVEVNTDEED